jgi:glutathione S-transferase
MTDITPRRLVLWGIGTSRTVRAHWALHELGLDYECRAILPRTGETQTAEYTELNPRQKIPLLQDGDFKIAESPAIAAYLSNISRSNRIMPSRHCRMGDHSWSAGVSPPPTYCSRPA